VPVNRAARRPFDEEISPQRNVRERRVNRHNLWLGIAIHFEKQVVNFPR
jgi:transposase